MIKTYTDDDEKFITDNYTLKGGDFCAKYLNRSADSIRAKALRMGLNHSKYWTKYQLEYLEENYPDKGAEWCQEFIGKTVQQIINKASKLKLKRSRIWLQDEERILIKNYPIIGIEVQKFLPNRSVASIYDKARKLHLSAPSQAKTHQQYDTDLMLLEADVYPTTPNSYINNRHPIEHACIEGHKWFAAPTDILKGSGCPTCSGRFSAAKPAILYYIKIAKENEMYYKIGVTNTTVKRRFNKDRDKTIEILLEKNYQSGAEAKEQEQIVLHTFDHLRMGNIGFLKSKGDTEMFREDILQLDS